MQRFSTRQSRPNINLWIVPLKMSLAALLLFAVTITFDTLAAYHRITIPTWITMGGIDDARAILSAMLGCVSTVLALIFSVALLVLSMVATLFGPRLLYRFVQDWVTQTTIGAFMAAFIYVFLCFLVTHQDAHTSFIPQVSLITSWFVVLAAFSFLVYYSHRIASLIQNPDAIARIVDDLRVAILIANQQPTGSPRQTPDLTSYTRETAGIVPSPIAGYLQEVDRPELRQIAVQAGVVIQLHYRPGQFILPGETLASIWPAGKCSSLIAKVAATVTVGRHRTLTQDLEFGLAQIVEIGIRALSPAINDTFTGIACVDCLGESLLALSEAPPSNGLWFDDQSNIRLITRPLRTDRLIRQAFDQMRQAAVDNPAVLIRLLHTIGRLTPRLTHTDDRAALLDQIHAVRETAASITVTLDQTDIDQACQSTLTLLSTPAALPA